MQVELKISSSISDMSLPVTVTTSLTCSVLMQGGVGSARIGLVMAASSSPVDSAYYYKSLFEQVYGALSAEWIPIDESRSESASTVFGISMDNLQRRCVVLYHMQSDAVWTFHPRRFAPFKSDNFRIENNEDPDVIALIEEQTGFFFSGGDQKRIITS